MSNCLLVLLCLFHPLHSLSPNLQSLLSTKHLPITSSSTEQPPSSHLLCFLIETQAKNKRSAFQLTNKKLSLIQRFLFRRGYTPQERALTVVKSDFRLVRARKSWSMIQTVCWLSEIEEEVRYEKAIMRFGVYKWVRMEVPRMLTQRDLVNKVFITARSKAMEILEGTGLEIAGVAKVETVGQHGGVLENNEREEYFNQSLYEADQSTEEQESSQAPSQQDKQIAHNQEPEPSQSLTLRVTFRLKTFDEDYDFSSTSQQL